MDGQKLPSQAAVRALAAWTLLALAMVFAGTVMGVRANAQTPALTTIADTLYGGSGSVTVVANSTFTTADGVVVPKGYEVTATVTDGALTVQLPPNAGATPSGSSYTAYYNVTPGGQFAEVWVVPSAAQPVTLAAVRTSPAPTPSLVFSISQVSPPSDCLDKLPEWTADGWTCASASGTGTVTSVGLSLPSWLSAAGSPVTTSGTLAVTAASGQTAHRFLGTGIGASFGPVAITRADLPAILSTDLPSTIAANTSGNAATASSLASAPTLCTAGSYPLGVLANGDATGCTVAGSGGGGSGSVTSVGLTAPAWLSVAGSPVTSSGTLALSAATGQTANEFLATPNGAAGAVALRAIAAADLPATISSDTSGNAGTASALDAVPAQCASGEYSTGISASGAANCGQVLYSQLGGSAPAITAAQVDAVGALTNNTSGNAATATALAALPAQCTSGQFATGIAASGDANCGTPSGSGSGPTLQTNGTDNASQSVLNLKAGSNVTLSNSGGDVTIAASGGSGSLPVVLPESYGAVADGKYVFDGAITPLTNVATGSSTAPATPAVATWVDGSVVDYAFETNTTWASAPATGTSQINIARVSPNYGLTVNDQTIATAAPVSSASGTTTTSSGWEAAAVVLTPSGGSISHVGTPTTASVSSGNLVISVPTGAVTGNVLIAYVAHFGTSVTWPSGFTLLSDVAYSGNRLAIGYIKLGASVPSSYTWTNAGTSVDGGIIGYTNVGTVSALSTLSSATAGFTSGNVADAVCTAATLSSGGEQCGSIAGYISGTEVFVNYIATAEPSDIWFGYGTDDSAAFTSMLGSAPCDTVGCRIQVGPYGYALTKSYTLPPDITIQIQGAGAGTPDTTNSFKFGTPANANAGSRLMFLTKSLTAPAFTMGGVAGTTNVAAWDRIADVGIIAGAGNALDGGGSDGIAILAWQDASLDRVIVSNFSGRGVYVDGTNDTHTGYISTIGFNQLYTIWNGLAGVQIGSSIVNAQNLETISFNDGISEGNGGPGVKLQGNIQGFTAIDNVIQWNNTASPSGKSELEIDNNLPGGCVIAANYFEVDDGDTYGITPGITGCNVINNYIAGNASPYNGHTGINTTSPVGTLDVSGSFANSPYSLPANTTPVLDLSASNIQQYKCPTAGATLAPTAENLVPGQTLTVIFVQNGTTACTWAWPSSFHGGGTVTTALGGISTQQFVVSANGTDVYAVGAMQSTTGGTP